MFLPCYLPLARKSFYSECCVGRWTVIMHSQFSLLRISSFLTRSSTRTLSHLDKGHIPLQEILFQDIGKFVPVRFSASLRMNFKLHAWKCLIFKYNYNTNCSSDQIKVRTVSSLQTYLFKHV